ncbi:MAG: hypothetical protein V1827_02070 [Candidatus Micrarchaeota archaeon]
MDKEVNDNFALAIAAIVIFTIIALMCGIIAVLFLLPSESAVVTPGGGETPDNGSQGTPGDGGTGIPGGNATAGDLALWDMINMENVEQACLMKAKEEAGENAGLVYSCDCEETISSGRKTYGCAIDTADPFTEYFANIDCFLADEACSIETNYGTSTVTFEELQDWYS